MNSQHCWKKVYNKRTFNFNAIKIIVNLVFLEKKMKEGQAKENLYFYHSVLKFKYHLNNVNLLKNISIFKLKGKNVLHFKLNAQKEGIIYLYK